MTTVSWVVASIPSFFDGIGGPQSKVISNIANAQTYGLKDSRAYFAGLVLKVQPHGDVQRGPAGALCPDPDQVPHDDVEHLPKPLQKSFVHDEDGAHTP